MAWVRARAMARVMARALSKVWAMAVAGRVSGIYPRKGGRWK